ncbi:hypothetical protein PZA11_005255 [Diplocarpon coronariae]|uniref:Uncharacterized protein n=1 Tax=Diplocarpon coronariae TaxID=2795749 RepID=A0A218ZEP4_9HELO|nr:hypothetical protein B2J93_1817 [Marssonina coronariae]
MSRNMRQSSTPPPARKVQRSSSQTAQGSDSDDDYGGVDDISGSEDDEPDVEVAEERAIISSEGEDDPAAPRPASDAYAPWEGLDWQPGDMAPLDGSFFEQEMRKSSSVDESLDEAADLGKHVHWQDLQESDSETIDSEDGTEWYGDLFMDKNALDPGFLRQIERDDGNEQFSDDGLFYGEAETDDDDDDDDAEAFDESNENSDSSGYDSDESGMTTDEEETPVKYIPPQRSVLRATSEVSTSSEEVTRRRVRRPPVRASWTHNSHTPYATVDMNSTKVKVFNLNSFRQRMRMQSATASPMTIPQQSLSALQASPMISNSGNIMMSAMMSDPFDDSGVSGQVMGPPEAYYPWTSIDASGSYATHDSSSGAASEDCDDEDLWNIEDLIEFEASEGEAEAGPSDECPTDAPPSSTPARPTTAKSEEQVHPLIDHFSSGVVGSFRFNQNRHQLLNRSSVTRESLAFGSSHLEGTIRGVKAGRLQHANTPITPVRKRRRPVSLGSGPASPSPYTQAEKKRKLNAEARPTGLKRYRAL